MHAQGGTLGGQGEGAECTGQIQVHLQPRAALIMGAYMILYMADAHVRRHACTCAHTPHSALASSDSASTCTLVCPLRLPAASPWDALP